jgi:hypothetical protein
VRLKQILAFALAATGAACSASPPQVFDGGLAGSEAGGNRDSAASNPGACTVVVASDYDQSCVTDTDCVSVRQVPECPVTNCLGCIPGAINKSGMARYMAALSNAVMLEPPGPPVCSCPCETGVALCREGKCQAARCSPPNSDTLPACANAGGTCGYVANTICNRTGPPDACAYSDELCCLN